MGEWAKTASLRSLDESNSIRRSFFIEAVAAFGSPHREDQPRSLVVPNGARGNSEFRRQHCDGESHDESSVNLGPHSKVKRIRAGTGQPKNFDFACPRTPARGALSSGRCLPDANRHTPARVGHPLQLPEVGEVSSGTYSTETLKLGFMSARAGRTWLSTCSAVALCRLPAAVVWYQPLSSLAK